MRNSSIHNYGLHNHILPVFNTNLSSYTFIVLHGVRSKSGATDKCHVCYIQGFLDPPPHPPPKLCILTPPPNFPLWPLTTAKMASLFLLTRRPMTFRKSQGKPCTSILTSSGSSFDLSLMPGHFVTTCWWHLLWTTHVHTEKTEQQLF